MQHISSIVSSIYADYPSYNFAAAEDFIWSPTHNTVYHPAITTQESIWSLLHEIAHAELGHFTYALDVELVRNEVAAWEKALLLAHAYDVEIDDEHVQDHLDTYRIWLHDRSKCPDCGQNGVQTKNTYSCINCRCVWRANEARICALRRVRQRDRSQSS